MSAAAAAGGESDGGAADGLDPPDEGLLYQPDEELLEGLLMRCSQVWTCVGGEKLIAIVLIAASV